jgi:hypothetical protein
MKSFLFGEGENENKKTVQERTQRENTRISRKPMNSSKRCSEWMASDNGVTCSVTITNASDSSLNSIRGKTPG